MKPKWLRGMKYSPIKALKTNLLGSDNFIPTMRNQGLTFPQYHFYWIEKNNLIIPLLTNHNRSYYSYSQLPLLDWIDKYKRDTLEYPNPTYAPGREILVNGRWIESPGLVKKEAVNWQDYLLANKEQIIERNKKWNTIARLLHQVFELSDVLHYHAVKQIEWEKKQNPSTFSVQERFKFLRDSEAYFYAEQIATDNPGVTNKELKMWATGRLPAYVIQHNPLYVILQLNQSVEDLFKKPQRVKNIFNKNNEVAIANYYVNLIEHIDFYLRCLTRGKTIIPSVRRLTQRILNDAKRKCAVCRNYFIPTNKRGGNSQFLCGKRECLREWRRKKRAEQRRRKK